MGCIRQLGDGPCDHISATPSLCEQQDKPSSQKELTTKLSREKPLKGFQKRRNNISLDVFWHFMQLAMYRQSVATT
uniref:Diphosphoinositol polyphosphate phosphohydrolase n=1 Tax=Rhizophora mucronata TaxID=61149 RepID=A0A2P2MPI4_RHIMU